MEFHHSACQRVECVSPRFDRGERIRREGRKSGRKTRAVRRLHRRWRDETGQMSRRGPAPVGRTTASAFGSDDSQSPSPAPTALAESPILQTGRLQRNGLSGRNSWVTRPGCRRQCRGEGRYSPAGPSGSPASAGHFPRQCCSASARCFSMARRADSESPAMTQSRIQRCAFSPASATPGCPIA